MACISASVADIDNVSRADRCYETGCGIPPGGYSSSSSPVDFQAKLKTTTSGVPVCSSKIVQACSGMSSSSTERKYSSSRHSWYPLTNNYYTVAETGYPVQTGSRPQSTWSTVTWPEIPTDDVKPTSFVLSPPRSECNANCGHNYCSKRYTRLLLSIIVYLSLNFIIIIIMIIFGGHAEERQKRPQRLPRERVFQTEILKI